MTVFLEAAYIQDLAGSLSQVLSDGTNTYTYGYNRISQTNADSNAYFLDDALGSVRQAADGEGEIILSRSYAPYGEMIARAGEFETDFGFASELADETGLVYLRARWYAPGQARFITRDSWPGNYMNPLSLNRWNYVEGNPINFVDPSGYWRWWLPNNIYHLLIEQYYEGLPTNKDKQLEFPIPGTPFRHPDMFNSLTGDIYEIEPWNKKSAALPQVMGYVTDLLAAAGRGALSGTYLGASFAWNSTPFQVGTGKDWPGKFIAPLPNFPSVNLVADFVGDGTVIYWLEPNALVLAPLPFLVPNKNLVKPQNWIPGHFAPQPAAVIDLTEVCGYGLIMVGGTILVATIAEDIATMGLGTFDDAVTVPVGIFFISLGHRLAVFVPATVP